MVLHIHIGTASVIQRHSNTDFWKGKEEVMQPFGPKNFSGRGKSE